MRKILIAAAAGAALSLSACGGTNDEVVADDAAMADAETSMEAAMDEASAAIDDAGAAVDEATAEAEAAIDEAAAEPAAQ